MTYQGYDPSEYLEHYGVKGMRWGIRRSRKDLKARTEQYRAKELGKVKKTYEKRLKKADRESKIWRAIEAEGTGATRRKILKAQRKIEMDYVKNMTWDDIKGEKRAVGKAWAKSALITVGTLPLQAIGLPSLVSAPSVSGAKTNYRLDQAKKKR